jgi:hypothetical protein
MRLRVGKITSYSAADLDTLRMSKPQAQFPKIDLSLIRMPCELGDG